MIYEGVHGRIPEGYDIDHINRDHHDNRIDNLRALPHSDHARLSINQRPNNHQVVVGNKYVPSGNNGRKLLEGAIKPPRATNWGRTPRVAYIEPGPITDVYDITVDETHNLIANGVVVHNCGEITLEPWEPCNLGHINLSAFVDDYGGIPYRDLSLAHKLMTRFLIRATFSPVGDPKSREVLDRNRRIGVGHLGVASFLAMTGRRFSGAPNDWEFVPMLRDLGDEVDEAAIEFCHQLRIPVPVKKRTVAPTGTIAKLAGVSEGIHPIFSKYFNRRIRFNKLGDDMGQVDSLVAQGYTVEDDLYAPNTVVVTIPTKDSLLEAVETIWGPERADELVESASDLTLDQLLSFQELYQRCWADNAVSFTANVDPDRYTATEVAETLKKFGGRIKGSTLFPEKSFPQAPYERISKQQYEAAEHKAVEDSVDLECSTGSCPIK